MLPEHVGTGDFILSPQVLKGEGFAFLPPHLAILLRMPQFLPTLSSRGQTWAASFTDNSGF